MAGRTSLSAGGDRPRARRRTTATGPVAALRGVRWARAAAFAAACLVLALVFGITTASADQSLGPHEARYAVTTDDMVTIDVGPLGTLEIPSPLPLTLGARVTVKEIPAAVTAVDPARTIQVLSQDLQSYVQFFTGPQAAIEDAAWALVADAVRRTALAFVGLLLAGALLVALLGPARRREIGTALARHRPQTLRVTAIALVVVVTCVSSVDQVLRDGDHRRASPVFAGTPLEGARITGRLAGVVNTYGSMVVDAYRENEAFYDRARSAVAAAWDQRALTLAVNTGDDIGPVPGGEGVEPFADAAPSEPGAAADGGTTGTGTDGTGGTGDAPPGATPAPSPTDDDAPGGAAPDAPVDASTGAPVDAAPDAAGGSTDAGGPDRGQTVPGSATIPGTSESPRTPRTPRATDAPSRTAAPTASALREPVDPVVMVLVADLHCNVGMARIIRTVAERAGADIVLNAGDTTVNGTSVEQYCVTAFSQAVPPGVERVVADGNHDSLETEEQERAAGWTVLDGEVVTVDGVRILGDRDPNRTQIGGGTTPVSTESAAEAGARLAETACDAGGVDILLLHTPRVGDAAMRSGCAAVQLSGHQHRRTGPVQVGRGIRYVSSTTAGATGGGATVGPLNGIADITVLRFDPDSGRMIDLQVVQVMPDASATVGPREPFPQPQPVVALVDEDGTTDPAPGDVVPGTGTGRDATDEADPAGERRDGASGAATQDGAGESGPVPTGAVPTGPPPDASAGPWRGAAR